MNHFWPIQWSLNHVKVHVYSVRAIRKAIIVCALDFHVTGDPHMATNPLQMGLVQMQSQHIGLLQT